jgi:uncharacterized protein YnzC (UPF0291/DUF896 family)
MGFPRDQQDAAMTTIALYAAAAVWCAAFAGYLAGAERERERLYRAGYLAGLKQQERNVRRVACRNDVIDLTGEELRRRLLREVVQHREEIAN